MTADSTGAVGESSPEGSEPHGSQRASPAPDAPGAPSGQVAPEERAIEAEALPEGLQQAIRAVLRMESYASPHPHPEHLERYAALYPDAPRIVFESFEAQGAHRREMEARHLAGSASIHR